MKESEGDKMAPLLMPSRDDLTAERNRILEAAGMDFERMSALASRYQLDTETDRLFRRLKEIAYLLDGD